MDPIPPAGLPSGWVWRAAGDGAIIWGPPSPEVPTNPIEVIISSPSGDVISAADGSIVPVTAVNGPTYIYIGGTRIEFAPGPGPVPENLPSPPNVGSLPSFEAPSFQQVHDDVYNALIQAGRTPQEAESIATNVASRASDDSMWRNLPSGSPEQISGAVESNIPDILTAGGAMIFVGGAISGWASYTSEQVNAAGAADANLVSLISTVKGVLEWCKYCTETLNGFIAGRSNPFVSWNDLGFMCYEHMQTLDGWITEAEADYLKWQQFDANGLFVGPNDVELTMTWASQMQADYDKWYGRCWGSETFTPTESATRRTTILYDATAAAVNTYDPESATDFGALPTP